MRSRQATKSVIEKGTGYLVTIFRGGFTVPLAVSKNVKDAYEFAKVHGQLTEPNKSYKGTIRSIRKDLHAKLWDKTRYPEGFPPQDYVELRPIKLL